MHTTRKKMALEARISAAELAATRNHPDHISNGNELKFRHGKSQNYAPSYLASFTKGIPHD